MSKHSNKFKTKVKFSTLPKEEKKKLLFKVFDILLSEKKKIKPKKQHSKGLPMYFLTNNMIRELFVNTSISPDLANKRQY